MQDLEHKKPEHRASERPALAGDFYPLYLHRNYEVTKAVLTGLELCYEKNPDPGFSVFKLVSRLEHLYLFTEDPKTFGLVCEEQVDDYGNKYLFLWGAYTNGVKYNFSKAYNTLKMAAELLECSYIETVSQRVGFLKMLERFADVDMVPTLTYRIKI